MKKINNIDSNNCLFVILALLALLIIIYLIIPDRFDGIAQFDLNIKGEDYSGMLLHLFIVAVIVERFIEVYVAIWRKEGRVKIQSELRNLKSMTNNDNDKISQVETELANYRANTGIRAMYGAFVVGLIIALAGVNTLGVLFDANDMSDMQSRVFKAIDILVTSGIIAGGSKGINKMSSLLSAFLNTAETNVRAKSNTDIT